MRDSADSDDYGVTRRGRKRGKFDEELVYAKRDRHLRRLTAEDAHDATDGLPEGDRWSTWDQSIPTERGPRPHPKWLVTDLAAVDSELGILKTGKEADVYLIRRYVPGTDKSCLLAAKRYRDATHRQFHRDSGYLEGRRVRESRVNRAVVNRSEFGRQAIAGQWANAEFNALARLYNARVPVPYPVQILGTEILLEFIGDADGTGAPRLAETRPDPAELDRLWNQLVEAMTTLASAGFAHGDLSPYNLLVHRGRLVMIDLPQVVDIISHPNGRGFLDRDAKNVATWFARAGHPGADPEALARLVAEEARLALAKTSSVPGCTPLTANRVVQDQQVESVDDAPARSSSSMRDITARRVREEARVLVARSTPARRQPIAANGRRRTAAATRAPARRP
jgi:RIO kinase 1